MWQLLGHTETVTYTPFPTADPALLVDDQVEYPIQVNGKVRGPASRFAADANNETIQAAALAEENIVRTLDGGIPKKVIVVPGRMVNIVA